MLNTLLAGFRGAAGGDKDLSKLTGMYHRNLLGHERQRVTCASTIINLYICLQRAGKRIINYILNQNRPEHSAFCRFGSPVPPSMHCLLVTRKFPFVCPANRVTCWLLHNTNKYCLFIMLSRMRGDSHVRFFEGIRPQGRFHL